VKGVGRKTAERLVVELKDRLPQVAASAGGGDLEAVLSRALVTLGLTPSEAERRARETLRESGSEDRLEVLLRSALRAPSRAASG
jgi:Holliday junction DNA helicase RuvA